MVVSALLSILKKIELNFNQNLMKEYLMNIPLGVKLIIYLLKIVELLKNHCILFLMIPSLIDQFSKLLVDKLRGKREEALEINVELFNL
jgi:hypothetical protein